MTFPCSAADGGYPCGAELQIEYQLRDALGAIGIARIPIAEGFVPGSDSCGTQTGMPVATQTATDSNGDFAKADTLALCSTACPTGSCPPAGSCALSVTQTISANGVGVRTNALGYACAQITVNGQ